jgi:hypothetical protein
MPFIASSAFSPKFILLKSLAQPAPIFRMLPLSGRQGAFTIAANSPAGASSFLAATGTPEEALGEQMVQTSSKKTEVKPE